MTSTITSNYPAIKGVSVTGSFEPSFTEILSPAALEFVAKLQRQFNGRRKELLALREKRQQEIDAGVMPDFLPDTQAIRLGDWQVAPVPADLQDRRVEITGPVDRKMIINALNSGAKVFMADLEDSNSPTWENCIQGQINLRDAVNRSIGHYDPIKEKTYKLNSNPAVLMVRPRGWHLVEQHIHVDGEPISGSLLDFGLYFFHNATPLKLRGTGPYFYLPKMESHLEARLWNEVFIFAQSQLGIPLGTIKATCLIETILASFELNEILYELRDHSAGLNCGRWDYIFSFIKRFRNQPSFLLPNRAQVGMAVPFMKAYSELVIQTCHRRGAHAMGGMAAQIPIKNDPEANEAALAKVSRDKEREAKAGHDGTWVAHPGLVPIALEQFNKYMPGANQIEKKRDDVRVSAQDLIAVPEGVITENGLRINVDVGIRYLAAWLNGNGCVPIYNLMEDAATAEICRTQVWQWLHHPKARLEDGRLIDLALVNTIIEEVVSQLKQQLGDAGFEDQKFPLAIAVFQELVTQVDFEEFLTLKAYTQLA